ncbi:DEAD/DEAH box helicase [Rhodopirellula sp. MGV]|uniref:DEAD/DEAH box helicase n=1 Tax=Rhodopirellula sp. MGV TaxID=2023130 RepID=UPI000B971AD0|nr:DEAD/DEAH box helicase [Rhodopirellula sp. MGV]OYP35361.1 DEAD/DEAH box helicase [Rhodopirellula sp. MGV]PNY37752.1 ATP-dependent helicase [Rhodopirellula baltica]
MQNFESLNLFAPLEKALRELNYQTPTPIQAKAIPPAIEGMDILGCASTGTGKTAAFAIPILDFLGNEKPRTRAYHPTVLILAPTRELVIQIADSFGDYGKHMKFRQTLVYGGIRQDSQVKSLKHGTDVLIATPGRLMDLMEQGKVKFDDIQIFVLDEADRMLDMGFLPALRKIVAKLPEDRQSMFFSATLSPTIRELAATFLFNPISVTVPSKALTADGVKQSVRYVQRDEKVNALHSYLSSDKVDRTIVFTRTKHGANNLVKKLERQGIVALAIHGNKSQGARQRALDAFRDNKIKTLVATDVAARGIDIEGVTHVVNFDMPVEPESYVHRVGRTGRAGAKGIAISYCTSAETKELKAIEKLIGFDLRVENPKFKFGESAPAAKGGKSASGKSQGSRRKNKSYKPHWQMKGRNKRRSKTASA